MYQPGSIFTPGTSIQGQLVRHMLGANAGAYVPHCDGRAARPVMADALTQCGIPAVLSYGNGAWGDGSFGVFVAGQVDGRSSPFFAPWPLSPLYLYSDGKTDEWQLTRLPDCVSGRQCFVSGVPSAVMDREELLVYFNGGQLLEYRCSPEEWWQVSAVPTPDMVVEANPVAIIAAGRVFVFCIPRGESLLMCSRRLGAAEWEFASLTSGYRGSGSGRCGFDGDPAVVYAGGRLHVLVSAVRELGGGFELRDFVVDPERLSFHSYSVAERISECGTAISVAGTPAAVSSGESIRVFVRSADGKLAEFASLFADGYEWVSSLVAEAEIAGEPGAVLLRDGSLLVCAVGANDGRMQSFLGGRSPWRQTETAGISNVEHGADVQRRPLPFLSGAAVSAFDLHVAV